MKITLLSIGKPHEPYVQPGIDDFTKRISKYFPVEWKILPPARQTINTTEHDIKKQEAQTVLNTLSKDDCLVLLDERGKQMTSPDVALYLQSRANASTRHLLFLIGGAFGVDAAIFAKASFVWSFSPLVFPHQLMRLMLSEQLYRACTIIRHEKYHHL